MTGSRRAGEVGRMAKLLLNVECDEHELCEQWTAAAVPRVGEEVQTHDVDGSGRYSNHRSWTVKRVIHHQPATARGDVVHVTVEVERGRS